jgi:hypothetical protein
MSPERMRFLGIIEKEEFNVKREQGKGKKNPGLGAPGSRR